MTQAVLVVCLGLATVALAAGAGTALVALAGVAMRRGRWSAGAARTRASLLAQARLAPLTLSLVLVPLVQLAFWRFEPVHPAEPTGLALPLLALAGAGVLAVVARHGWQSLRATDRVARAWRRAGQPTHIPGWQGRAWIVRTEFPVVAVVGLGRAELFVSAEVVDACSAAEIAAIAAHERAHVTGRDNLTRLLFALAPAAGSAPARLERAWATTAEEIADLHARATGDGLTLAQALTKVARLAVHVSAPTPPLAISSLIGGNNLEGRVRRLLEPAPSPNRARRGLPAVTVVPVAVAAALWCLPAIYDIVELIVTLGR